jgi:uncharacterized RDD family membrane protein YckC
MDDGVVTPEAVVLAFATAGVGSRILSALLDLGVQLVGLMLVGLTFGVLGSTPFGLAGGFVGLFAVMFGYPVAMETLWRGRTLGKAALGLRVVTVEGGQIRFRHALIRAALGLVDLWLSSGAIAILCVLISRRNQRLGDLVAGTLVLRERTGARAPMVAATFAVPAGWEGYAATIDVGALSTSDYEIIRSFLLRAATLDPHTRDYLARQIAKPLLTKLHHQPPPWAYAEMTLLCAAARFQARGASLRGPSGAAPHSGWTPGEPVAQGGATARPGERPAPGSAPAPPEGFTAPE